MTKTPIRNSADEVRLVTLGGLGEIGLNMMVVECRGRLLIIDAGVMFPEEDMLGVDMVIPDITYLLEKPIKSYALQLSVRAIVAKYIRFAKKLLRNPVIAESIEHF